MNDRLLLAVILFALSVRPASAAFGRKLAGTSGATCLKFPTSIASELDIQRFSAPGITIAGSKSAGIDCPTDYLAVGAGLESTTGTFMRAVISEQHASCLQIGTDDMTCHVTCMKKGNSFTISLEHKSGYAAETQGFLEASCANNSVLFGGGGGSSQSNDSNISRPTNPSGANVWYAQYHYSSSGNTVYSTAACIVSDLGIEFTSE